jgi:tetratricopeptide (TPR) repeat protein
MKTNAENGTRSTKRQACWLAGLLLVTCALLCPLAARADAAGEFDAANKLYEQGRYREAVTAYETLARIQPGNAAVHFNLGNAHFKSGQNGMAIAAYRQAQRLAPRDPDIRANLKFARNQVSGPNFHRGWLPRQLEALTLNEWTLLAVMPVWGLFALLGFGQLRPAVVPRLRTATLVVGAVSVIGIAALVTALLHQTGTKLVVVTARDTIVRHGPLEESQSAFTVANGAELRWLDEKDDWYLVTTSDQRNGWLKSNAVLRLK